MKFNFVLKLKIFINYFLFLFLFINPIFYARGTKKIGAVQSIGEQGVRLSVLLYCSCLDVVASRGHRTACSD